jgi:hypothetical protein
MRHHWRLALQFLLWVSSCGPDTVTDLPASPSPCRCPSYAGRISRSPAPQPSRFPSEAALGDAEIMRSLHAHARHHRHCFRHRSTLTPGVHMAEDLRSQVPACQHRLNG